MHEVNAKIVDQIIPKKAENTQNTNGSFPQPKFDKTIFASSNKENKNLLNNCNLFPDQPLQEIGYGLPKTTQITEIYSLFGSRTVLDSLKLPFSPLQDKSYIPDQSNGFVSRGPLFTNGKESKRTLQKQQLQRLQYNHHHPHVKQSKYRFQSHQLETYPPSSSSPPVSPSLVPTSPTLSGKISPKTITITQQYNVQHGSQVHQYKQNQQKQKLSHYRNPQKEYINKQNMHSLYDTSSHSQYLNQFSQDHCRKSSLLSHTFNLDNRLQTDQSLRMDMREQSNYSPSTQTPCSQSSSQNTSQIYSSHSFSHQRKCEIQTLIPSSSSKLPSYSKPKKRSLNIAAQSFSPQFQPQRQVPSHCQKTKSKFKPLQLHILDTESTFNDTTTSMDDTRKFSLTSSSMTEDAQNYSESCSRQHNYHYYQKHDSSQTDDFVAKTRSESFHVPTSISLNQEHDSQSHYRKMKNQQVLIETKSGNLLINTQHLRQSSSHYQEYHSQQKRQPYKQEIFTKGNNRKKKFPSKSQNQKQNRMHQHSNQDMSLFETKSGSLLVSPSPNQLKFKQHTRQRGKQKSKKGVLIETKSGSLFIAHPNMNTNLSDKRIAPSGIHPIYSKDNHFSFNQPQVHRSSSPTHFIEDENQFISDNHIGTFNHSTDEHQLYPKSKSNKNKKYVQKLEPLITKKTHHLSSCLASLKVTTVSIENSRENYVQTTICSSTLPMCTPISTNKKKSSSITIKDKNESAFLISGKTKFNNESPVTKMKFKAFYRQFWITAKDKSPKDAFLFALNHFKLLPPRIHWRICLEIADLAKRHHKIATAREWYQKVNELEPRAPQGWLERAKMEEECGQLVRCQEIMGMGLKYCQFNESLMVKAIKHLERMGNIKGSRAVLASLQNISIDKVWRTVLEGALMEARAGKVQVARQVFKYLMKHVSWYGPIYYEASKFEERRQQYARALDIAERGLHSVPRYGPLWFCTFRLNARLNAKNPSKARNVILRATRSISMELLWKVYFESSQFEEREKNYKASRQALALSIKHCPKNLRWKTWLSGARMELRNERIRVARQLLNRSLQVVPKKMRAVVLLECSRLEEFVGSVDKARSILQRAKKETGYEWKVFLESILLEIRANNFTEAISEAHKALKIHPGTGRLWAILIQLKAIESETEQYKVFKEAVRRVPKSGEVWCEGARIFSNPMNSHFNLKVTKKFLKFAIGFTPQYGDSFIEYLRLQLLTYGPCTSDHLHNLYTVCINSDPNYGAMWFRFKKSFLDTPVDVLELAKSVLKEDLQKHASLYHRAILRSWSENIPAFSKAARKLKIPAKHTDSWKSLTSLYVLYTQLDSLSLSKRYQVLFGSEPLP